LTATKDPDRGVTRSVADGAASSKDALRTQGKSLAKDE
jgi:hypothetical protein